MSEKEQVSAHIKPSTGTAVESYERKSNRKKKELSPEELEARQQVSAALMALNQEETTSVYFEPVDDFTALPDHFQMATIATIADVPWAAGGDPGTGKTVGAKQIGEGLGLITEVVRAGASMQSDFDGIPAIVGEAGQEHFKRMHPEWALNVKDKPAFVFLDELNRTAMDVQNAVLNLVSSRSLEGLDLGGGVRIAAAFNPDDDGITEFSEALRRRFMFIDWPIDREVQLEHYASRTYPTFDTAAVAGKIPGPDEFEERVDDWATLAYGFHVKENKKYLHERPKDEEKVSSREDEKEQSAGYGFPNKGSWESAFRLLVVAESLGAKEDTKRSLVQACVGNAAGSAFWAYQNERDLPGANELLANPDSYVTPLRDGQPAIDKVHVISRRVVGAVETQPTPERWTSAIQVACRMQETGDGDIGAGVLKKLMRIRRATPELKGTEVPVGEVKKYAKILMDSGLLDLNE